jgi:hypothetical protein
MNRGDSIRAGRTIRPDERRKLADRLVETLVGRVVSTPEPVRPASVEHPIMFSEELLRATAAGLKTVTRRPIKPQVEVVSATADGWFDGDARPLVCPYGRAGQILWVREKWARQGANSFVLARLDPTARLRWKASRYMPRAAARLLLVVTSVGLERLNQIDTLGLIEEGFEGADARARFMSTWNQLYVDPILSGEANPWVWVIGYRVRSEDAVSRAN